MINILSAYDFQIGKNQYFGSLKKSITPLTNPNLGCFINVSIKLSLKL